MSRKKWNGMFCTVVLAVAFGRSAHAGLIINGGFETNDLTGWTESGVTAFGAAVTSNSPFAGAFAEIDGAVGGESILSQTILSSAGVSYTFSAWYNSEGCSGGCSFSLYWNGAQVLNTTNGTNGYEFFNATVVGLGNDTVGVGIRNDPAYSQADQIDVTADAASAPEPSTLSMFGLTLLAPLAMKLRRKKV